MKHYSEEEIQKKFQALRDSPGYPAAGVAHDVIHLVADALIDEHITHKKLAQKAGLKKREVITILEAGVGVKVYDIALLAAAIDKRLVITLEDVEI